jgi:hypothetical protein
MGNAPWERERRVNGDEVVITEVASGGDRRAVVAGSGGVEVVGSDGLGFQGAGC